MEVQSLELSLRVLRPSGYCTNLDAKEAGMLRKSLGNACSLRHDPGSARAASIPVGNETKARQPRKAGLAHPRFAPEEAKTENPLLPERKSMWRRSRICRPKQDTCFDVCHRPACSVLTCCVPRTDIAAAALGTAAVDSPAVDLGQMSWTS